MPELVRLSARILNAPLLLEPGYARIAISSVANRLGIISLQDGDQLLDAQGMTSEAASYDNDRERYRPYEVVGGAAVLPVSGSLVHKSGSLRPYSGMTGYDGIIARAEDAFGDRDIKGVLLDLDTPGGEVAGCFDTAQELRRMADAAGKPLWASCWDMNCSAGMALASSAHRRLITQTGIAGSIGVVMAHASYAKHLEEAGVKVTLIHSGAQKVNGNPYADLPDEVLAQFQQSSDQLRLEFAQLVSGHMGISVEDILATEAATYRGQAAVDIGLADELINGHEMVAHFVDHLSTQGRIITIGATMSNPDTTQKATTPAPNSPAAGTEQPAPVAAAPAPAPAADAAITPEAAAAAAMQRVQGIMGLEGAADYSATTNYMAFSTGLTVEQAKGLMATLPAPSTTERMGTALDGVMANEQQPEVGADAGDQPAGNQLLADYELITGDKQP